MNAEGQDLNSLLKEHVHIVDVSRTNVPFSGTSQRRPTLIDPRSDHRCCFSNESTRLVYLIQMKLPTLYVYF
jgi:hypothetical protein